LDVYDQIKLTKR